MRLSLRLTVVFGCVGLLAVASLAVVAWLLAADEVRDSIDDELVRRATVLAERPAPSTNSIEADRQTGRSPAAPVLGFDDAGVQFFAADGTPLGEAAFAVDPEVVSASRSSSLEPMTVATSSGTYRIVTVAFDAGIPDAGFIQFFREISDEESALSDLALRLAVVTAVSLVALAAASWIVGRWLSKPLDELTVAAERLAELDDMPGRIEITRGDEIGSLAGSFNRVLSALEVGRAQQRRLVADASHELRTPLTSVRMRTEFLAANLAMPVEERAAILRAAVSDVEQLSTLVSELLELAADLRGSDEAPQRVRLADLVVEVAQRSEVATGRSIIVDADESEATVRPSMVRRALQNLVDNAVKYSPDTTPIGMRLNGGRFEVEDEGCGIPDDDLDRVFDRFFRSEQTRTRPGTGLGLAIVAQVAEAHGGSTWAGSAGTGARVGFSIGPALRPQG